MASKAVRGDGQIAAGQVLGLLVVEHDMARRSGRGADDRFLPGLRSRVPDSARRPRRNRPSWKTSPQPGDPLRVRLAIVVGEGENVALRELCTGVAGVAQAAGFQAQQPGPGEIFLHEVRGAVGGAVIHDDGLESAAGQFPDGGQAVADAGIPVAGADDDAEEGGVES